MPAWLTWKLFWKVFPYIAGALALLGAVWYIDHRGYQRAKDQDKLAEQQRKTELAQFELAMAKQVQGLQESMQTAINNSDSNLIDRMNGIQTVNKTVIQPTLTKEIQSEKRFTDPTAGITDGMLRELNRARSFSQQRPCPAGSNAVACFSMPDAQPVVGQGDSNSSPGGQ